MPPNQPGAPLIPPHDPAAEEAALGCLLIEPAHAPLRFKEIEPAFFYTADARLLHEALARVIGSDQLPDTVTVYPHLARLLPGDDTEPAAAALLSRVCDRVPSAANFEAYVQTLRDQSFRRALLRLSDKGRLAALDPAIEPSHAAVDFASIASDLAARAARRTGLSFQTSQAIMNTPLSDTDNYLGDRLLAAGQSLVICGSGGIGKSRLLLQLAACAAAGLPWLSLETHAPGKRWLIIQAENSTRRLQQDLHAIHSFLTPTQWAAFNDLCLIHTLDADTDYLLSLDIPGVQALLEDAVSHHHPDIVAWDSLYNFGIGDLNKDEDMKATLLAINRISTTGNPLRATVVIHHATTGRAGAAKATGIDRSSFARNSKVIHSWARAQINLTQAPPPPSPGPTPPPDSILVSCGKSNNGREFDPFGVSFDPSTLLYSFDPNFSLDSFYSSLSPASSNHFNPKPPACDPATVRSYLSTPMPKASLAKLIIDDTGCSKTTAYHHIHAAIAAGLIQKSTSSRNLIPSLPIPHTPTIPNS